MRKVVVALACAAAQVAPGAALLSSALTLGLHASDHAHSVSLVADGGHVQLVLSHEERGHRDGAAGRHHDEQASSISETDHVFRLTDDGAASTATRRAGVAPAPAVATAVPVLPAPSPQWVLRASLEPRARSSDSLGTVVLRL